MYRWTVRFALPTYLCSGPPNGHIDKLSSTRIAQEVLAFARANPHHRRDDRRGAEGVAVFSNFNCVARVLVESRNAKRAGRVRVLAPFDGSRCVGFAPEGSL
jgi:hypothetical protein